MFFTARIERALSHRARSASKKNGLPTLSHPSEAARCASTEDHQAPYQHPSKLDRLLPSGMAPVSVLLRPSSEHILIVRAPGAKDRYGCYSLPSSWQGTTRHSAGHDRWRATGRFLPIDADYRDSTLPRR